MIAGEISYFKGSNDEDGTRCDGLIELTEWGDQFIEIAANAGNTRVYLKFRLSDLLREVKEARTP